MKIVINDNIPVELHRSIILTIESTLRPIFDASVILISVRMYAGGMKIGNDHFASGKVIEIRTTSTKPGAAKTFVAAQTSLGAWRIQPIKLVSAPPQNQKSPTRLR